jgi:putative transposase
MGMQLRNKTPKRRVKAALRADRTPPSRSNEVWAMDFVHDQLAMGTKLRVLTVVDTFSRYALVVDPRLAYRGADVVATLERVCKEMGYPRAIRVDQGSEFVSRDLDLGRIRTTLRSTSHGPASRPTTPSSRRSTAGFVRSA